MSESFNLRTAGKKPVLSRRPDKPFRLQENIHLAASDRYNDPYDCSLTARRIRDRFVISLDLMHGPVANRTFSKNWIFEDMETCWSKFHIIKDIVTDTRDFIEVEGLKNVIFQYMLKHSLSAISADVENIYETSNPNARTVIDPSTRGNLIKNFPTLPFNTQSGPDELDSVYGTVGNAPNPVPLDGIKGEAQLAYWQHERKEKGMRDIMPSPISKFQEAAGIEPGMFKGAASQGVVKTAEADKSAEFVEKVSENSEIAKNYGKKAAIDHYMKMTGADEAEADAFYNGVRAACVNCRFVLNLSPSAVAQFLTEGEYVPIFENSELEGKFNHYAIKREQVEKVLGCDGLSPAYASVTFLAEGDRGYGSCGLTLEDVDDKAILLCGDSFRVRNASRPDFVADPELIMYSVEDMPDCKASATICSMGVSDLAGGPAMSLSKILEPNHEFGRCEALIFKKITPENVSRIVAATEKDARTVRKLLAKIGRIVPVIESEVAPKIVSEGDKEQDDEKNVVGVEQKHFCVGDRVALKPMASHPKMLGTVIGLSNGNLTVEWDDKNRSMYDMAEALMRIMSAPSEAKRSDGMVIYSLPGMDGDTAQILSGAGVDPVTLYALASHYRPASPSISGWIDNLIKALDHMGIKARKVSGYASSDDGDEAFKKKDWLESKLASGARLVMDIDPKQIVIRAGDPEDYVLPDPQPKIVIE